MFDTTESRVIPSDPRTLEGAIPPAIYQAAMIPVQPVMPLVWQGTAPTSSYFMKPQVWIRAQAVQGGTQVEVRVSAELEVTIFLFLLFWPAFVIIFWMGMDDFNKKKARVFPQIWQSLGAGGQVMMPSPYGVGGGLPPGQPGGGPPPGAPGGYGGQYG